MASIDEERSVAEQVDSAILTLSPSAPILNAEAIIEALRNAVNLLALVGAGPSLSSEVLVNLPQTRGDVGIALFGLIRELENGSLTQEAIDDAKRAVEDWKNKLGAL